MKNWTLDQIEEDIKDARREWELDTTPTEEMVGEQAELETQTLFGLDLVRKLKKVRQELTARRDAYQAAWRDSYRADEYQSLVDLVDGKDRDD